MIEVEFRPDHTYAAPGGIVLPGLTSRLRRSGLNYEFDGKGGFRDMSKGNAVHSAIHYALEGDLDESTCSEEELAHVHSAQRFIEREEIKIVRAEYAVGSIEFGYATKIDLYCIWRGKPTVANWKTGPSYRVYAIQSALEALIFSPQRPQRLGIHLSADGDAKPVHYTDRRDFDIAKAALTCAAWTEQGD
jgi:hypothetical protein